MKLNEKKNDSETMMSHIHEYIIANVTNDKQGLSIAISMLAWLHCSLCNSADVDPVGITSATQLALVLTPDEEPPKASA